MCDGSVRMIGSSSFFNYHKDRKKQGGASVMADTEKIIRKKYDVPIWHKSNLTIDEAVEYSGIGRERLRKLTSQEECPFVLHIGNRRMIKRRIFDEYIEKLTFLE